MSAAHSAGQRAGSGLRVGVKLSVFKSDGTTLLVGGSTITENASTVAQLVGLALGTEATAIVIKVEATLPQDTNVTGTYHFCQAVFHQ